MMNRKDFLRSVVGIGVGAVGAAWLAACGDDGGSATPDAAGTTCTSPQASIGTNHGHTIMVTIADVNAGAAKTYDITGDSDHSHMLTITANQMTQIKNGQTLNLTSTSGGAHTHVVTVMCVS